MNMKAYIANAGIKALTVGVGRLYLLQTESERSAGHTSESNGVGFSMRTDKTGTYIGSWIFKGIPKAEREAELNKLASGQTSRCSLISGKFVEKARWVCDVHHKQLSALAARKATAHVAPERKVLALPAPAPKAVASLYDNGGIVISVPFVNLETAIQATDPFQEQLM